MKYDKINSTRKEMKKMNIKVGISRLHVHFTEDDFKFLFGDQKLTKKNDLTQKGQFAANETVTIKGPKGEIKNVRIIGPFRNYTQVEISKTDSYALGLNPPIRTSGDLENAEEITIINNDKSIKRKACIIANRHIHITKEEQERLGLHDKLKVKIAGDKSAILDNVYLKLGKDSVTELHLDTDDANACLLKQQDEVEIVNE